MQVDIDNRGRQRLLPKELAKKILGHSPDKADALALAVYAKNHGGTTKGGYSRDKAEEVQNRYLAMLG
jgi:hypothetical protein